MSSSKRRRRQRDRDFQFHGGSDDKDPVPPSRSHPQDFSRYTEMSVRDRGLSAQTSFIATMASPATVSNAALTTDDDMAASSLSALDDMPAQDVLWDNSDVMDTNVDYLHELVDMDESLKKRRRTAGVSEKPYFCLCKLLIISQDHPLREWIPHRDAWLAELLRHEGRCGFTDMQCPRCQAAQAEIRCSDCNDLTLYCQACTVEMHRRSPYHRLKVRMHIISISLHESDVFKCRSGSKRTSAARLSRTLASVFRLDTCRVNTARIPSVHGRMTLSS